MKTVRVIIEKEKELSCISCGAKFPRSQMNRYDMRPMCTKCKIETDALKRDDNPDFLLPIVIVTFVVVCVMGISYYL